MSDRPEFALGTGGCQCSSCTETRIFDQGFAKWPRGNPAGRKRSQADYAAHVAESKRGGIERAIPAFRIQPEPHFDTRGLNMPIAPNPVAQRWIVKSEAWRDRVMPRWGERPARRAPYLVQLARDLRTEAMRKAA